MNISHGNLLIFYTFVYLNCLRQVLSHDDNELIVNSGHYVNDWVIQLNEAAKNGADSIAKEFGYKNLGAINGFENIYLFRKENHPRRTKRHAFHFTKQLIRDKRVVWAEQQIVRVRVKRDFFGDFLHKTFWWTGDPLERGHKEPLPHTDTSFNDELWNHQWYLHDTRNIPTLPRLDLNVKQVWKMGYTGKGVVLSVMDDGLEWNHTDIIQNYDPNASCDTNDNDLDPFPRYDRYDSNNHGTRCAGEIAMIGQNRKCGVGIAFNAKIGGIRCLDGEVSDIVEAMSIGFKINYIDIYSSSWGPNDDGMTVDGPKRLATEALIKGVTEGRKGKGCIYVWASGNGGMKGDNCNCDGYASSIYTLSIGSASQQGQFPWYGERCSSTMAVTYSSGGYTDQKIATIDLHNKCTIDHTGTSAAAPLAAGIIALVLEANPNVTWRDMQHLVVWTSEFFPLMDNKGWKRNSAGLMYNCRFGFGLINAEELVKTAIRWINVPPKMVCHVNSSTTLPISLESGNEIHVKFINSHCGIYFLEHVQINLDMDYTKRGNLDIYLSSPKGTISMLLSRRPVDTSIMGFRSWNLTSVHFWGENPLGHWNLMIRDKKGTGQRGRLKNVYLILHGTREHPEYFKKGSKLYKQEDLIGHTIDPVPEYFESDLFDPNLIRNNLNPINSPSQFEWTSDLISGPMARSRLNGLYN